MPLHLLAEAFIADYKAAGGRPVCSMSVEEARRVCAEMFAFGPPAEEVARVEDSSILAGDHDIPVRIYSPRGEGPFPILVYLHGGGWVVGDLEANDADCRTLVNAAECVVVSVEYRLSPEYHFPLPAEDAYWAMCWVAENSARLSGDGAPIAVGGMSAGGNLAAVVALMAQDRGGPSLACQVLTVPVIDFNFGTESYRENGEDYILTRDEMEWFWGQYLATPEQGANPYASPLRAPDLSCLPPALVQTAEYDPLRDEGQAYAERLTAAGVPVTYRCYQGMIHMVLGPEAVSDVVSFLKEQFGRLGP
jgi:acetyl esterase